MLNPGLVLTILRATEHWDFKVVYVASGVVAKTTLNSFRVILVLIVYT